MRQRQPLRDVLLALRIGAMTSLLTCGGDPPTDPGQDEPIPGPLAVTLATGNRGDGALLIVMSGPGIDSVTASGGLVAIVRPRGDAMGVLLYGSVRPGAVARLWVPDTRQVAEYTALLEQVAALTSFQQRPVTDYTLTLTR